MCNKNKITYRSCCSSVLLLVNFSSFKESPISQVGHALLQLLTTVNASTYFCKIYVHYAKKKKKISRVSKRFFCKAKGHWIYVQCCPPPPQKKITDYIFLKLMSKIFTGEKERCVHPLNESWNWFWSVSRISSAQRGLLMPWQHSCWSPWGVLMGCCAHSQSPPRWEEFYFLIDIQKNIFFLSFIRVHWNDRSGKKDFY